MDPGFHRGDGKAGMTETRVNFPSTKIRPLGLEPRVVQCPDVFVPNDGLSSFVESVDSKIA